MTMKSLTTCLLALTLALMGGCATQAQSGATIGGLIGGAAGYALCVRSGRSHEQCQRVALATGVVGGYAGWQMGKERDLAMAQQASQELSARRGVMASTQTAYAKGRNDQGQPVAVPSFKAMDVTLAWQKLRDRDPDIADSARKLGVVASLLSEPSVVTIASSPEDRNDIELWVREGIGNRQGVATIRHRPLPHGSNAHLQLAPANQAQFAA